MPHAHSMPSPGFQALILCGPGVSLNTFTSSPEQFPKALVSIANRAMIWYPLEWCYRMGITTIHLITPASSASAIELALSTDPHLTSLPLPRPDIIAPKDLSQNTGTAEILRLPEVRIAVKGDFIVLPCDLVCELGGEVLAESWMVRQAGLGGETGPEKWNHKFPLGFGGERIGRRGGLGVWYHTKADEAIKKEETDFIATLPPKSATVPPPRSSLLSDIHRLAYSIPTDTLNDLVNEQKSFAIRRSLLRQYGRVRLRTSYRNAHIYFFPFWVIEFIQRNKAFDSISEDVIGWWSKATWQRGLGTKLGMTDLFGNVQEADNDDNTGPIMFQDEMIDLMNMTSTGLHEFHSQSFTRQQRQLLASRTRQHPSAQSKPLPPETDSEPSIPPILAYVQPSHSTAPLIRRVDTGPLLLATSLRLARFEALDETGPAGPSPFAHKRKIATPSGVAQRCTVTKADCLLDENVVVEEKAVIKECVVGANCRIGSGARLTRCLLMDGVTVGERCQLNGCILGKQSRIGKEAVLRDCEVQGGYDISDRADAKGEKFMVFEGLDDTSMDENEDYNQS